MAHTTDNDKDLVAQLRQGSIKAFETVYRLYVGKLYSYCYEAIHVKQEAEEVVHDIFMILWNHRATLSPDVNVGQVLYAIARKRRIDAFRRLMKSPVDEDYVMHQNSLIANEAPPLEYDDFKQAFHKVLDSLPARQRVLIVLSKIDGLSNHEIAEQLNVSEKTIRNQLSLAIKEFQSRISPYIGSQKKKKTSDE